jgi:FkbM family methyltransferase
MMQQGKINARWDLIMPDFRVEFHAKRELWEASRLAAMFDEVEEGQTIVDVGAEHGDFTALYRQWVGDSGVVVPVEPQSIYWPCIRETWKANGYPEIPPCYRGFVDDQGTDAEALYHDEWPDEANPEVIADPGFLHLSSKDFTVPRISLDYLAGYLPAVIDHVVLDIEGAELLALQGARRLMSSVRPTMWVSVHPPPLWEWYGASPEDIETYAYTMDYTTEILPSNGEGEAFWVLRPR